MTANANDRDSARPKQIKKNGLHEPSGWREGWNRLRRAYQVHAARHSSSTTPASGHEANVHIDRFGPWLGGLSRSSRTTPDPGPHITCSARRRHGPRPRRRHPRPAANARTASGSSSSSGLKLERSGRRFAGKGSCRPNTRPSSEMTSAEPGAHKTRTGHAANQRKA